MSAALLSWYRASKRQSPSADAAGDASRAAAVPKRHPPSVATSKDAASASN